MEDFKVFIDVLKAGGDTVVLIVGFIVWRFHERLSRLERKLSGEKNDA